jgi:biopolymer transport protein ExbD
MKFPRNARIFRGSLDAAPFVSVFFLLVIFVLLGSLVYTPGIKVPLRLPQASGLAGADHPAVAVAVDNSGQLYFQNQRIGEIEFSNQLQQIVRKSQRPLSLVVRADTAVTYGILVHLEVLARETGVQEMLLATLPRVSDPTSRDSENPP